MKRPQMKDKMLRPKLEDKGIRILEGHKPCKDGEYIFDTYAEYGGIAKRCSKCGVIK